MTQTLDPYRNVRYLVSPEYHRICTYLGLGKHKRQDFEIAKKVSLIVDTLASGKNETEVMQALRGYIRKRGYQELGTTLLNKLFIDIRLDNDIKLNNFDKKLNSPQQVEIEGADNKKQTITVNVPEQMKKVMSKLYDEKIPATM